MKIVSIPTRSDVDWEIDEDGMVTIIHEKLLGRLEGWIVKLFKAPSTLRRPLDEMNSYLWILMDGKNTLEQIIVSLDSRFSEKIDPVYERVTKSIHIFIDLGLAQIVDDPTEITWETEPRHC